MKYNDIVFRLGFIYNENVFYIDAYDSTIEDFDVSNYALCRYDSKQKEWECIDMEENAIGFTVFSKNSNECIFGVSEQGDYFIEEENGFRWHLIDETEDAPNYLRHLTSLSLIGDTIYTVGMRRMVYKYSIRSGVWHRIDNGIRQSNLEDAIYGLYAIHGLSNERIYSVGLKGEIWKREKKTWKQLPSITNANLIDVIESDSGYVYACGEFGVLIRGIDEQWEIINNDSTDDAFVSIALLDNDVYMVSDAENVSQLIKMKLWRLKNSRS